MRRHTTRDELARHPPPRLDRGRHPLRVDPSRDAASPRSTTDSILTLQGSAGNAAVAAVLGGQTQVQRQPKQPKKPPKWVTDAQARLVALFPKDPTIAKVVIKDYTGANKELQTIDYGAWTQSKSEIYLRDPSIDRGTGQPRPAKLVPMILTYVLRHEAVHVGQFATDGKPPGTWQLMLEYEKDAYKKDFDWLRSSDGQKQVSDQKLNEELEEKADGLVIRIGKLLDETAGKPDRENELYKGMIAGKLIPAGAKKDPGELYKQP